MNNGWWKQCRFSKRDSGVPGTGSRTFDQTRTTSAEDILQKSSWIPGKESGQMTKWNSSVVAMQGNLGDFLSCRLMLQVLCASLSLILRSNVLTLRTNVGLFGDTGVYVCVRGGVNTAQLWHLYYWTTIIYVNKAICNRRRLNAFFCSHSGARGHMGVPP